MMLREHIFREYDIRGRWLEDFDEEFCFALGRAFVRYASSRLGKPKLRISVGYDARLSSERIFDFVVRGLNVEGAEVLRLGLVPTPVSYFSLFSLDVDGNVMITASHNPKEYNGFKLSVGQETLFGEEILAVEDLVRTLDETGVPSGAHFEDVNILRMYKDYMLEQFGYLRHYSDDVCVVLDGGNGVAGFVAYDILKGLNFGLQGLFLEPDGTFPNHHPDPIVEKNVVELRERVMNSGCTVGIGYDGDGDRMGVVASDGRMVYGDMLLLFFAQDIAKRYNKPKVIGEVKCSRILFDGLRKAGCEPIMWKAGHSLIKSKMREEKAQLAGEMSGHMFFKDRYFGYDDAIYASLRLLEILRRDGVSLMEWLDGLPRVFNTPELRVSCPDEKKWRVVEAISDYLDEHASGLGVVELVTVDGVRFEFEDGWGLIRASNTQPALVLRFEAVSEDKLNYIKNKFESLVQEFINKI